ncbi:hypothetical protein CHK_0865 [Christensenella hongkongensis]|uniref:Uncharacterized protein n=1 Tax=Christensenella hongkongensis TaxID=270498 RepID=A0A0M2NHQ4_9FIRM|nr:hypothetical protein CHK_0865 [Christensenella hongkongensis]
MFQAVVKNCGNRKNRLMLTHPPVFFCYLIFVLERSSD